jgi:hypothetical protein
MFARYIYCAHVRLFIGDSTLRIRNVILALDMKKCYAEQLLFLPYSNSPLTNLLHRKNGKEKASLFKSIVMLTIILLS